MASPGAGSRIGEQAAAGALWNSAGFACLSLCGYVIAVLLARGFGPVAYGVYGVVYSVLLASEQIVRLGIPQALTKLIGGSASSDQPALESAGVWIGFGVGLAGFAVLWVAAPWLADWLHVTNGAVLFRIAILDIPFFSLYRVLVHILSGRRDFRVTGAVACVYALTRAGGIAILFFTNSLSIEGALIVNVAASVVGALLIVPRVGMHIFRPVLHERRTVLVTALPITVSDIGIQCLIGIDLWLLSVLGHALAPEIRGEYVAALSLARGPNILGFVLVSFLVPLIARARSTGEHAAAGRLVMGTMRFLLVLLVPACALVAANAAELMVLFFGESYRHGAILLAILIFAQGLGFTVLAALQAIVIGTGHAAQAAHRLLGALVAALVLNLVLIPAFGAVGAAIAAVLAFAISTILVGALVRRELGVLLEPRQAILALAVSLGVGLLSWRIPSSGAGLLAELAGLGIVTLAAMRLVGVIMPGDVQLLLGRQK